MNNYKLLIQYDGTNYAGWQIQNNAVTIQQKIVDAIKIITREEINLIGSGRTDTGVHALGQVANFKTDNLLETGRFQYSLNSILPPDIAVLKTELVDEKFHSRFDAVKRSYIYLISKIKSPFYKNYSYYLRHEQNCILLNNLSKSLTGEHNFTSFARKNTETKNKICKVYNIHWRENNNLVVFKIEADRFLHGMVRTIVGTLLNAVKKNYDESYLLDVLNSKDREAAGEAVPAKGLSLFKVKY